MTASGEFWTILAGALVAASCGLLGTFLVLRRMSMLGDAISHAVLPGIVIAFLLSGSRAILPMFLGAAAFGLITAALVEAFHRRWRVPEDAAIGITFTALFAAGVVLISMYAGQVDLDQECVLYGEIAYTPLDTLVWRGMDMGPRPVWILSGVLLLNLVFVSLCYKELTIASFDPAMAVSVGISASLVHYLLMAAVSVTTVASFESVGAILVVAMLIVPGASAYLWSDRLWVILVLSVGFGIMSAAAGYYLAGAWNTSISGAMVAVLGAIFATTVVVAPGRGLLSRAWQRFALAVRVGGDHMLLAMVRRGEAGAEAPWEVSEARDIEAGRPLVAWLALGRLRRLRLVTPTGETVALSPEGRQAGLRLLRGHRLWESYLSELGLPDDHTHEPADAVEHFLDEGLQRELDEGLEDAAVDPQGKQIPPLE